MLLCISTVNVNGSVIRTSAFTSGRRFQVNTTPQTDTFLIIDLKLGGLFVHSSRFINMSIVSK